MPILIITAKESATDKREGFRLGTDDYMVKPIDVNEMVWRVEALLRRSQLVSQRKSKFGETEFNCDTLTISSHEETTELPQKEFYLLYKLITSRNRIFTRRRIMDDVWGRTAKRIPTHWMSISAACGSGSKIMQTLKSSRYVVWDIRR